MSANTLQFRRSERIRFSTPVQVLTATSPDAPLNCETLLVNLNGCGVRAAASIPVGSSVHVRVGKDEVPGRVVTCIQASGANAFSIGIKFDRPYFWPVPNPPADWIAHPISKSSQSSPVKAPVATNSTAPPVAPPIAPKTTVPPPAASAPAVPKAAQPMPATPMPTHAVPAVKSSETIKEINEAVARAVTITSKLDALVQTLPAQLEARLKEKAEQAAKAAQAATIAQIEKQVEAQLKQRASDVHLNSVGQCTAELDAKIAVLKQQAEDLRTSLSKHADELRAKQDSDVSGTVRTVEEKLAKATAAAVKTFKGELENAAAVYSELQNVGPAEELLEKLGTAVRAADDKGREMTAREAVLRTLHSDISAKAAEVEQVSSRLTEIMSECRRATEAAGVIRQMQAGIDEKLQRAESERQSLDRAVQEGVASIRRERDDAVSAVTASRQAIAQLAQAVTDARGVLGQLHSEAAQLRENIATESRRAVDELLRSAASLQMAAVDLEQQATDSFSQTLEAALAENLGKFELHVKAATQRFASALHAAAHHAFLPAHGEEEASIDLSGEPNSGPSPTVEMQES